jgi:hypothetical protein
MQLLWSVPSFLPSLIFSLASCTSSSRVPLSEHFAPRLLNASTAPIRWAEWVESTQENRVFPISIATQSKFDFMILNTSETHGKITSGFLSRALFTAGWMVFVRWSLVTMFRIGSDDVTILVGSLLLVEMTAETNMATS